MKLKKEPPMRYYTSTVPLRSLDRELQRIRKTKCWVISVCVCNNDTQALITYYGGTR